jgi:hypothetical protein
MSEPRTISPTQLTRIEGYVLNLLNVLMPKLFARLDTIDATLARIEEDINGSGPTAETGNFNPQSATTNDGV